MCELNVFISLGYVYLEVELLGHEVIFCLNYEVSCIVLLNIMLLVEFTLVVVFAESEFCHIAFPTIPCNAIMLFFCLLKYYVLGIYEIL